MNANKAPLSRSPTIMETMTTILGSNYQVLSSGTTDPIVLAKLPDEDLAPKNSVIADEPPFPPNNDNSSSSQPSPEKTTDDYLFQFYLGSMTVVGLFILFRMIQKSK